MALAIADAVVVDVDDIVTLVVVVVVVVVVVAVVEVVVAEDVPSSDTTECSELFEDE